MNRNVDHDTYRPLLCLVRKRSGRCRVETGFFNPKEIGSNCLRLRMAYSMKEDVLLRYRHELMRQYQVLPVWIVRFLRSAWKEYVTAVDLVHHHFKEIGGELLIVYGNSNTMPVWHVEREDGKIKWHQVANTFINYGDDAYKLSEKAVLYLILQLIHQSDLKECQCK